MELLINATNRWKGAENAAGDGSSLADGVQPDEIAQGRDRHRRAARRRAAHASPAAWATYQRWIFEGAQECSARPKPGGKGYVIEWGGELQPVPRNRAPGKFYSTALGDRAMGLNIALGDLDRKETGAGNFGNFHHEDWFAGEKNLRTQLRQWGTLWIRTQARPASR